MNFSKLISKNKVAAIILVVSFLTIGGVVLNNRLQDTKKTQNFSSLSPEQQTVEKKFTFLSTHGNTNCSQDFTKSIPNMNDDKRLEGSCCSPMNEKKYMSQIEGLKQYKDIPEIPSDPYDIPVKLAKELINYNQTIKPTDDEQKILDEGAKGSDEKGFCCCKCWRWEVHEGMSKFLVRNYHFTAKQISELLDLQDGCGGGNDTS